MIEPFAKIGGGHWTAALPRLALAAAQQRRRCVVICLNGVYPDTRAAIRATGAVVIENVQHQPLAWVFVAVARLLRACYYALRLISPSSAVPLHHLSSSLIEAASLRVARRSMEQPGTAVILTANGTLHAFASKLGRLGHVRFVHDAVGHEGRIVRTLDHLSARAMCRARFVCATDQLARKLENHVPGAQVRVIPFATRDSDLYLSGAGRDQARRMLGLESAVVGSLIGSWWKSKDVLTVLTALEKVNRCLTVLVAGDGIDHTRLSRYAYGTGVTIRVIDRVLDTSELATVYGASDFTIVSRFPDGMESGTAYDAVQRGTALICSDHDPDLAERLGGRPWARLFRAGDAEDLARTIERVCDESISRPPRDAADVFGLVDAGRQLTMFDEEVAAACQ